MDSRGYVKAQYHVFFKQVIAAPARFLIQGISFT